MEKIWIILAILGFLFEILSKRKKAEKRKEEEIVREEWYSPEPEPVFVETVVEEAPVEELVTEEQLPRHIEIIAPAVPTSTPAPKTEFVLNPATARDAIIWMEVLRPPKGLQQTT